MKATIIAPSLAALSFFFGSVYAADWRNNLSHIAPIVLSVIETYEIERGIIFTSPDEVDALMQTKEFQNKLKTAQEAQCLNVSNTTLLCRNSWGGRYLNI